jgi:hypothetical protein
MGKLLYVRRLIWRKHVWPVRYRKSPADICVWAPQKNGWQYSALSCEPCGRISWNNTSSRKLPMQLHCRAVWRTGGNIDPGILFSTIAAHDTFYILTNIFIASKSHTNILGFLRVKHLFMHNRYIFVRQDLCRHLYTYIAQVLKLVFQMRTYLK